LSPSNTKIKTAANGWDHVRVIANERDLLGQDAMLEDLEMDERIDPGPTPAVPRAAAAPTQALAGPRSSTSTGTGPRSITMRAETSTTLIANKNSKAFIQKETAFIKINTSNDAHNVKVVLWLFLCFF
jgi:hypothetical protein